VTQTLTKTDWADYCGPNCVIDGYYCVLWLLWLLIDSPDGQWPLVDSDNCVLLIVIDGQLKKDLVRPSYWPDHYYCYCVLLWTVIGIVIEGRWPDLIDGPWLLYWAQLDIWTVIDWLTQLAPDVVIVDPVVEPIGRTLVDVIGVIIVTHWPIDPMTRTQWPRQLNWNSWLLLLLLVIGHWLLLLDNWNSYDRPNWLIIIIEFVVG